MPGILATTVLAKYLKCNPNQIKFQLRDEKIREKVLKFLHENFSLYIRLKDKKVQTIHTHGIQMTVQGVAYTPAFGGYKQNLNVDQLWYARHCINLKDPKLQCLVRNPGTLFAEFFPLELVEVMCNNYGGSEAEKIYRPLQEKIKLECPEYSQY